MFPRLYSSQFSLFLEITPLHKLQKGQNFGPMYWSIQKNTSVQMLAWFSPFEINYRHLHWLQWEWEASQCLKGSLLTPLFQGQSSFLLQEFSAFPQFIHRHHSLIVWLQFSEKPLTFLSLEHPNIFYWLEGKEWIWLSSSEAIVWI